MNKKKTLADIQAEIRKRTAMKRLEENRKNTRPAARPAVRPTVRPIVENRRPVARPVVQPRVIKENLNTPVRRQETLMENVQKRNRMAKLNQPQSKLMNVLAENIVRHDAIYKQMKGLTESVVQAGPGVHDVMGNGAGVGMIKTYFDILYGYFPELVTPHIASTQPLKTEQGFVFYLNYTAGDNKGTVEKGQVILNPFMINTPIDYTSDLVGFGDVVEAGAFSKEIDKWQPVKAQSLGIEGADLVWTNDTDFVGTIGDATITDGKFTQTETHVKVEFTLDKALDKAAKVAYLYDNKYAPTQIPSLSAEVMSIPLKAKYRTMKTNIAFQAAYGFAQEHGGNLDEHLAKTAMEEIKREIDLEAVFTIFKAAPSLIRWNKNAGYAVGGYTEHKLTFMDAVAQASNRIFHISRRVRGNVLIVGTDVFTIVETLPAYKGKDLGEQLAGAAVVGKLGSMPVILVPELPVNEWAVIFKDTKDNLNAGLVFAPYLPVYATEPTMLDDLVQRRAFITAYAMKVINPNYFVRGEVIDSPTALPIYLISKDGTDAALGKLDDGNTLEIFG